MTTPVPPAADRPSRTRSPLRLVLLTGLGAALIAVVLTLAVHACARWIGGDLMVSPPGQPTGPVSTVAVLVAAALGSALAVLLALLLRAVRPTHSRGWFLGLGVVGLVLSFVSPLGAAQDVTSGLWLCTLHVTVAAPVLLLLARTLPGGTR